jgi:hypothetical protein
MAKALPQPWAVEDFLAFEAEEPERYEYVGDIVRMGTGGSAAHSAIKPDVAVAQGSGAARSTRAPRQVGILRSSSRRKMRLS